MVRAPASLFARLLLALCVLASALQGHVAQTHVHAIAGSVVSALGPDQAAAPAPADPACLLCEIAGHSAAAAPLAAALPTQLLELSSAPATAGLVVSAASHPSHHWQGRGPPPV